MDPVLLDILSREVALHLGAIREFVARPGRPTLPTASRADIPRLPHPPRQPDHGRGDACGRSRGATE